LESTRTQQLAIRAVSIELALSSGHCPYCGKAQGDLSNHLKVCPEYSRNIEHAKDMDPSDKWGMHDAIGKVFILSTENGLSLVEGDFGRYVVPVCALKTGQLSAIIETIENTDLSEEEIGQLINALRVKSKTLIAIPRYPELKPGCRIEIQLGNHIKAATIKRKCGPSYRAHPDGHSSGLNVSPKQILRIL
jgi:hypothetical protein